MDFDIYDCKKVGFLKQNHNCFDFHDNALKEAENKTCFNLYFYKKTDLKNR